uniref:Uncharacterized protein n=1 Tax=Tanacetum cinerariifolium TaxID=118510 RepID=A0A6L2L8U7_TANCI|nr:hypothetical protein [Tanacetum cinerariifolium]
MSGGGEAILHAVNRLIEDRGDDVGLSMLLVDFKNAFNLALELIMKDVPSSGLHLNVDKTEVAGIFSPNIGRPLHRVKLLGGPASVYFDFNSELVMKKVTKTIVLMDTVARINDPQMETSVAGRVRPFGIKIKNVECVEATMPNKETRLKIAF